MTRTIDETEYLLLLSASAQESRRRMNTRSTEKVLANIDKGAVTTIPEKLGNVILRTDGRILIEDVIKTICNYAGVSRELLLGHGRQHSCSYYRHNAIWLAKKLTGRGVGEIGRRFGGRNYTSILYAIRQVEKKMVSSESLRKELEFLVEFLQSHATDGDG